MAEKRQIGIPDEPLDYTSDFITKPYDLDDTRGYEDQKHEVLSGELKRTVVGENWKIPSQTQERRPQVVQALEGLERGVGDIIKGFLPQEQIKWRTDPVGAAAGWVAALSAPVVVGGAALLEGAESMFPETFGALKPKESAELTRDKLEQVWEDTLQKESQKLEKARNDLESGKISQVQYDAVEKQFDTLVGRRQKAFENIDKYNATVQALDGTPYPNAKVADAVVSESARYLQMRELNNAIEIAQKGIDPESTGFKIGSLAGPTAVLGAIGFGGNYLSRYGLSGALRRITSDVETEGGAARLAAIKPVRSRRQAAKAGALAVEVGTEEMESAQYVWENVQDYIERTGDKNLEYFTPQDAKAFTASAYGAIAGKIETMGGIENIAAGAFRRLGVGGFGRRVVATGAEEFAEEGLQNLSEYLSRRIDGTTDKTLGEALEEALNAAAWGGFMGIGFGTIGGVTYRNARKQGIKVLQDYGLSRETAEKVFDNMIEQTTDAISPRNEPARENIRKKVALIYENADLSPAELEDTIEATTDLEMAMIAYDAANRGIDIADHPLLNSTVNNIGWFRDGIPEQIADQVEDLDNEIGNLRRQLAEENAKEKPNMDKIDDLEAKIEQFYAKLPKEVSDLVETDRQKIRQMLGAQSVELQARQAQRRIVQQVQKRATSALQRAQESDVQKSLRRLEQETKTEEKKAKETERQQRTQQRKLRKAIEKLRQNMIKRKNNLPLSQELFADADLVYQALRDSGFSDQQIANMAEEDIVKAVAPYGISPVAKQMAEQFDLADENARLDDIYPEYTGETIDKSFQSKKGTDQYNSLLQRGAVEPPAPLEERETLIDYSLPYFSGEITTYFKNGNIKPQVMKKVYALFTEEQLNHIPDNDWYNIPVREILDRSFGKEHKNLALHISIESDLIVESAKRAEIDPLQFYNAIQITRGLEPTSAPAQQIMPFEQFDLADENARLDDIYPAYKGETIEVDGKERTVYNSNGDRIAKSKEALTNFWKWFGDSKVVDSQGRPLVVYHGTNARFDTFDARFIGSSTGRSDLGLGFYFSSEKTGWLDASADWYGSIIIPVYLKMDNPFVVPEDDLRGTELGKKLVSIDPNIKTKLGEKISDRLEKNQQILMRDIGSSTITQLLLENKYDGVISDTEFVAFEPTQIKSVDNRGTYSPDTGNILYQNETKTYRVREDRPEVQKMLVQQDALMSRAKEFFGTTTNWKEAGYILPDGTMLDFSGAHAGGMHDNTRKVDHRDIADAWEEEGFPISMEDFINAGAIRFMPENMSFLMSNNPTSAQLEQIDSILQKHAESPKFNKPDANIELMSDANEWGNYNSSFYKMWATNPDVKDIKKLTDAFYKGEGITPAMQTLVPQTRVSGKGGDYRGFFVPEYRLVVLTQQADPTTAAHEFAHDWMQQFFRFYRSGKANESFMKSWGALEKALGITDDDITVPEKASEAFARAFEAWVLNKPDWEKGLDIDDDNRQRIVELFKRYQGYLTDIYEDLNNPYFRDTWGETGKLKPELQAWFDKVTIPTDLISAQVATGAITPEEAQTKAITRTVNQVVQAAEDNFTQKEKDEINAVERLNDTKRYEVEGGNKNSLQNRLSGLARDIDANNIALGRYDTHRDMLAVAQAADEFVRTRRDEALNIINGLEPEKEGLYASDLYTALERVAMETNDVDLAMDLVNSKVAKDLAKEWGQRVAGFRNFTGDGEFDAISQIKSLDNKYKKDYDEKGKERVKSASDEFVKELDKTDSEQDLDSFFDSVKCQ